jgi:uncharacterized protein (DUF342 family)
MFNDADKSNVIKTNSTQEDPEKKDYIFNINISANRMQAFLRVVFCEKGAKIDPNDVLDEIKEQGIKYGVKEAKIVEYCNKGEYFKELIVADGVHVVHGKDASISYHFNTDNKIEFKEKEDGTIDFKDINNILSIEKDGLLCTLIPETEGKNGMDVFGNEIQFKPGKALELPHGKNTYKSPDNLKLYAAAAGAIYVNAKNIDINTVYTVKNVDNTTGNINFAGTVIVQGDVRAGFTVIAKDDIIVRGMVEGAVLESGKDITISNGMNGRDVGTLTATGTITSKYLENSTIKAGKNVFSDAIINCNVFAGENIVLKGARGIIIGGESVACESIRAKTIGTKNNIQTKLEINIEKYMELHNNQKNNTITNKINAEIKLKENEVSDLNDKINFVTPFIKKSPENERLYKLLIIKKSEVSRAINDLKTSILELDNDNKKITDHKVVCSGVIYANTRITIGWLRLIVREDLSYSKLYNDGNDIQITALLPSDMELEAK